MVDIRPFMHPYLNYKLVDCLKTNLGIFNVRDFMRYKPKKIADSCQTNHGIVNKIRKYFFSRYPLECTSGFEGVGKKIRKKLLFSTSNPSLDKILGGGLMPGKIYEIYGPSSSGKSYLAFYLSAITVLTKQRQNKVVFFDSKNDFDIEKVFKHIKNQMPNEDKSDPTDYLDQIRVFRSFFILDCIEQLKLILKAIKDNSDSFWSETKLIILDSIASLALPYLPYKNNDLSLIRGHISKLNSLFRSIINETGAIVLIINHSTNSNAPALGKLFSEIPNYKILLYKNQNERVFEIKKFEGKFITQTKSDLKNIAESDKQQQLINF